MRQRLHVHARHRIVRWTKRLGFPLDQMHDRLDATDQLDVGTARVVVETSRGSELRGLLLDLAERVILPITALDYQIPPAERVRGGLRLDDARRCRWWAT